MKQKRSQLDIIRDMLVTIQNKGGRIKPTHLLYKSNLSSKMLKEYVDILKGKELITEEAAGERRQYVITDKGHRFLSEYQRLAEFTDAFGL